MVKKKSGIHHTHPRTRQEEKEEGGGGGNPPTHTTHTHTHRAQTHTQRKWQVLWVFWWIGRGSVGGPFSPASLLEALYELLDLPDFDRAVSSGFGFGIGHDETILGWGRRNMWGAGAVG